MQFDRQIILYISGIAAVIIYGTLGTYILGSSSNFNVPVTTLEEALYFTVTTISTVGYGDIVPVTPIARAFVIILIISGLSIFLSALTVLSGELLSARIQRMHDGTSRSEQKRFKGHIILVGYDTTNAMLAEKLKREGKHFIVISPDKTSVDKMRHRGYNAYLADYTLRADMERFGIDKASDVVIDLKDSSQTVYVVLVIRKLSKNVRLSVVVQTTEIETHLSDLAIDHIINPLNVVAQMLDGILNSNSPNEASAKDQM